MSTILIADDSATVRSTVKVHLMGHGHEFLDAEDGSRALRLLRVVPVAIAIVDYRMPGLDGISLIAAIRADGSVNARVPMILVSSDHDLSLRERAIAAGASAFLRKPVSGPELFSAVTRLMALVPSNRTPSASGIPAVDAAAKKIRRAARA